MIPFTAHRAMCCSVLTCAFVAPIAASAGDCQLAWSALEDPDFNGTSNTIQVLTVFDDGSGPALYAGGWFAEAGGEAANRIAKWDGANWSPLEGPNGVGVGINAVHAMAVFDDGSGPALYVGGDFTTAGGMEANHIARWDGTNWSALEGQLADGTNGTVRALQVFDDGTGPALYAGGQFTTAGGSAANYVAKWDGSEWSGLKGPGGNGANDIVWALSVFDDGSGPALYAGGDFTAAGGVASNSLAKWDGADWEAVEGIAANTTVLALTVFDDGAGSALFAGGLTFSELDPPTYFVGEWDGTKWSLLEGPNGELLDGRVHALTVFDDGGGPDLYATGWFDSAGGVPANNIARWDGTSWSALEGQGGNGLSFRGFALSVFDSGTGPDLYVGGQFFAAGGITADRIARWGVSNPADVTGDGSVNLDDLNIVLTNFGQTTSTGDTDGNGVVDLDDLNAVLTAFGTDCP